MLRIGQFMLKSGSFIVKTGAFLLKTGAFIVKTGAFLLKNFHFFRVVACLPDHLHNFLVEIAKFKYTSRETYVLNNSS